AEDEVYPPPSSLLRGKTTDRLGPELERLARAFLDATPIIGYGRGYSRGWPHAGRSYVVKAEEILRRQPADVIASRARWPTSAARRRPTRPTGHRPWSVSPPAPCCT